MKVKDLINQLKGLEDNDFVVSCDEELNTLFSEWQISKLTGKKKTIVIFGLSGSEIDG
jgi:hypothetical protein